MDKAALKVEAYRVAHPRNPATELAETGDSRSNARPLPTKRNEI